MRNHLNGFVNACLWRLSVLVTAVLCGGVALAAGVQTQFTIEPIPDQKYTGSAVTPVPVLRALNGMVIPSEYFDFAYSANTARGIDTARVTVSGKAGMDFDSQEASATFSIRGYWYVTPDAAADGAGTAWDAPCSITNVAGLISANDIVLVKAGTYQPAAKIAFSKVVEIRGGFEGTDDTTLAANPYSVIDGQDALATVMSVAESVTLRNLEFTRAGQHALVNTVNGKNLRVYDCRFVANGTTYDASWQGGGRAISWGGLLPWNTGGTCIISNTVFSGNAQAVAGGGTCGGGAVAVSSLQWAKFYDCTFTTNGVAWTYPTGSSSFGWTSGAACINAPGTPLSVIGCTFAANRIASNQSYGYGYLSALIRINATWDKNTYRASALPYFRNNVCISNCLFVGNSAVAQSTGKQGNIYQGIVSVYDTMDVMTCRVDNCTFAYNQFDTTAGSAGLTVGYGAAKVRNCLFWGNRIAANGTQGCDVKVTSSGSYADIDYSLFADTGASNIFATAGALALVGDHVVKADPKLVTSFSDVEPLLVTSGSLRNFKNDTETAVALMAINAHVTNKTSKAIDAGDPSYPYDREPAPNGECINLGFYGGTPEACVTPVTQPEIDGEVELTLPYGTTQPHVHFKLGGNPGDVYAATVMLEYCTNDTDYIEYAMLPGYGNGDTFDHLFMTAFQSGGSLKIRVTVLAYGAHIRWTEKTVSLEDVPMPASFGNGGGAGVLHVRPDATGDGSGRDWFHAMTSFAALSSSPEFATATEIWVSGTNVVQTIPDTMIFNNVAVRGGFAGTENAPAERQGDACAVFDGGDRQITAFVAQCKGTVLFDRLAFTHGGWRGMLCSCDADGADITFRDCRIVANGLNRIDNPGDATGFCERGMYLAGNNLSTVTLTNCLFAGNAAVQTSTGWAGGGTLRFSNFKWANVDDCTFVTNGVAWTVPTGSSSFNWNGRPVVINAEGVRLRLANSRFVANRIASTQYDYAESYKSPMIFVGGLTAKADVPWDISISNCLFVGNEAVAKGTDNFGHDTTAPVYLENSAANVTCRIDNCTFAYNNFDTTGGSAGLVVRSGTARVRNCIFHGNRIAQSGTQGCDVKASGSSGTIDIDYSLFAGTGASNIFAAAGTTILVGDHVVTGDPMLNTSFAEIEPLLATSGSLRYFKNDWMTAAALQTIDAHVTNKLSKAIDAGDPDYPYALEPSPNGGRINLGRYGGTAEACTTAISQPEFAVDPVVTLPYGTTQPRLTFTLGGDAEAVYTASVQIECCTNGADFFAYRTLEGLQNGDAIDHVFMTAFQTGGTLKVRVTVSAFGAEPRIKEASVTLDKPVPASFGKGGGAGILHVRPGATGDGSGRDWFHAVTAVSALPTSADFASASEIWIAGTNVVTATPDAVGFANKVVRGGFVGMENTLGERQAGAYTVFDGEDRAVIGFVANCSGNVLFERFLFTRNGTRGVNCQLAANASVTFKDCRIVANGLEVSADWTDGTVRGLKAYGPDGNKTAVLTLTNCLIAGNAARKGSLGRIGGMAASNLKRAYLYDCAFVTNGVAFNCPVGKDSAFGGNGAAAFSASVPVTMVGCSFVGNRVGAMWDSYGYVSAILQLASSGNALTNCLFVGNESMPKNGVNLNGPYSGTVLQTTSGNSTFERCTFAYNFFADNNGAVALTILNGSATVRNSIFYGNRHNDGAKKGADIWLTGSACSLDVDYTMFDSISTTNLYANAGSTIATNAASHLYAADPKFVSALGDFQALQGKYSGHYYFLPDATTYAKVLALNVHLRGRAGYFDAKTGAHVKCPHGTSPAIDAGDPLAPYANEPTLGNVGTSGGRLNLGCYGNTPWATMTGLKGSFLRLR